MTKELETKTSPEPDSLLFRGIIIVIALVLLSDVLAMLWVYEAGYDRGLSATAPAFGFDATGISAVACKSSGCSFLVQYENREEVWRYVLFRPEASIETN